MATINNIKKRANDIKNAYEPESVTAEDVGGLFNDMADVISECIEDVGAAVDAARAAEGYLEELKDDIENLPDGQAVSAQVAVNEADISILKGKTSSISKSSIESESKEIRFETDEGVLIGKIDSTGANFTNLKKAGNSVAIESQIPTLDTSIGNSPSNSHTPSTKAVKDYVDAHGIGDLPISGDSTASTDEEMQVTNDAGTQTYAQVGSYGIKSTAYLDMSGNSVIPTKDTTIGSTPSQTNVPTSKAVADYVAEHGGSNPHIEEETIQTADEEIAFTNNNKSETYVKVGNYGMKSKAYLDMQGNDILANTGTIRLLFIGSSFGVDTVSVVGEIVQSFGKKIIIGNAYIGAATLSTFISRYNNHQGMAYYKWFENATSWSLYDAVNGEYLPNQGTGVSDEDRVQAMTNTTLDFILQDEPWDYIILQNGAYQSPYPDQSPFWTKDGGGNITRNIVQELVAICKKNCIYTNPVFGMNMTWAFSVYHTISSGHLNDDFWVSYGENQGARQLGMYNNIATNYSDCLVNCEDIRFIIPSGTTIQLARQNQSIRESTNYTEVSGGMPTIAQAEAITSLVDIDQTYPYMDGDKNWKNKSDFTRDSIHADMILTRFLASATLYQKLLSKLYKCDIADSPYRQGYEGSLRAQLATPVDNNNFPTLVGIIKTAIANPFSVNSNQ